MIKPELYKRTTDILYQSYFDDLLKHGDGCGCAVGNICAGNGVPRLESRYYADNDYYNSASWMDVFSTINGRQLTWPERFDGYPNVKRVIEATGYDWQQLAKIEFAFEAADKGETDEDYMFNGLVAVLEVLKEIHQVTDEDLLQSNNKRFKDHYNKRVGAAV